MKLTFNFIDYLVSHLQEGLEQLSNSKLREPILIRENDQYALIRSDEYTYLRTRIKHLPRMFIICDKDVYKVPIIVVNNTWDRVVPQYITDILLNHELGHVSEEAKDLTGDELEFYCDQYAINIVGYDKYKEAMLWVHNNLPGVIPLNRITPYVSNTSFSFKLAKMLKL